MCARIRIAYGFKLSVRYNTIIIARCWTIVCLKKKKWRCSEQERERNDTHLKGIE